MNTKNGILGSLAIGLAVLMIAGMVSALDVTALAGSSLNANGVTKSLIETKSQVKASDAVSIKSNLLSAANTRADMKTGLKADMEVASKEKVASFKTSVRSLKNAIIDFKTKLKTNSSFNHPSPLWNVSGWVQDSELTAEQKTKLIAAYKNSKSPQAAGNWHRQSFVMWSMDHSFVSIGKLTQVEANGSTFAYARGFSTFDNHRFAMVMGDGLIVGTQNGMEFWGTYANGKAKLVTETGTSMELTYKMY